MTGGRAHGSMASRPISVFSDLRRGATGLVTGRQPLASASPPMASAWGPMETTLPACADGSAMCSTAGSSMASPASRPAAGVVRPLSCSPSRAHRRADGAGLAIVAHEIRRRRRRGAAFVRPMVGAARISLSEPATADAALWRGPALARPAPAQRGPCAAPRARLSLRGRSGRRADAGEGGGDEGRGERRGRSAGPARALRLPLADDRRRAGLSEISGALQRLAEPAAAGPRRRRRDGQSVLRRGAVGRARAPISIPRSTWATPSPIRWAPPPLWTAPW